VVFYFVFAMVGRGPFVPGPRVASCPWADSFLVEMFLCLTFFCSLCRTVFGRVLRLYPVVGCVVVDILDFII
jgi:hypothetical protein